MKHTYWQDLGSNLLIRLSNDPVLFSEVVLGANFDGYEHQKELLSLKGSRKIMRWGRRMGATSTLALHALFKASMKAHRRVAYLVPWEDCGVNFFRTTSRLMSRSAIPPHLAHLDFSTLQALFDNGSEITCYDEKGWNQLTERDPHVLLIDYAESLSNETLQKIENWLRHRPHVEVIASSYMVVGRRRRWQDWSREADLNRTTGNKHGWQGTHVPSTRGANWTTELEEWLKESMTPAGYRAELLAEYDE